MSGVEQVGSTGERPGYTARDRDRWVPEDRSRQRADRDDFARDRGRLVHSASLRRLSAKTQVVQPGSSDFVRTRLTHSLEVAQIGREFGQWLGCDADVVDTACLAHDLGHPPFGHNGETALDEAARDIGGFEGNAQTLRVLTRLEAKRSHPDGRSAGLNLTRASLDAATKYPWRRDQRPTGTPKFGVYDDDLPVYRWFRAGVPDGARCLEAEVMDWSDDVAYSVHDVEDAIASGRLDPRVLHSAQDMAPVLVLARDLYAPGLELGQLEEARTRLVATGVVPSAFTGSRADLAALKHLTSRLVGRFVVGALRPTRAKHGEGPLTRYAADLVVPDEVRAECSVLKAVAAHWVMYADERLSVMAEQRATIAALVEAYRADPIAARPRPARRPRRGRRRRGPAAGRRRPGRLAHRPQRHRAGPVLGRLMAGEHPLGRVLREAAAGRYPLDDGGWERVPPWRPGVEGVLAVTGHAYLAVGDDVPDARLDELGADGIGGAHDPRLVAALAGTGQVDCLDVVLAAPGRGGPSGLVPRPDLEHHPRVAHARRFRIDVTAYGVPQAADGGRPDGGRPNQEGADHAVVSLGRGIGGLWELGLEVGVAGRRPGHAVWLATQVRRLVPVGEPVLASTAPGNTRALRVFLAAGFVPVGSVQVWRPER